MRGHSGADIHRATLGDDHANEAEHGSSVADHGYNYRVEAVATVRSGSCVAVMLATSIHGGTVVASRRLARHAGFLGCAAVGLLGGFRRRSESRRAVCCESLDFGRECRHAPYAHDTTHQSGRARSPLSGHAPVFGAGSSLAVLIRSSDASRTAATCDSHQQSGRVQLHSLTCMQ
jgi:hypothetical protein